MTRQLPPYISGQIMDWKGGGTFMRRQTKRKRSEENSALYMVGNFLVDVLLWIPQLLLLPFRWCFSASGRCTGI